MPARQNELAWWQRPVRMMRRDYLGDIRQVGRANMAALAREDKQVWHINCEWVMANMGCSPGLAHITLFDSAKFEKNPELGRRDLIRDYLPHARKNGIHLVPYINLHWFSYEFAARHPGWEQVLQDGTPYGRKYPLYGNGTTFCINSPWRDWAFDLIREVMTTGVDGCFLDGPAVFPESCYCAHCRKLFQRLTNQKKMPSFGDWSDPLWKTVFGIQIAINGRFSEGRASRRVVRQSAGVMFCNGGGYNSYCLEVARDAARVEPFQNFTSAEEFYHTSSAWDSPYKSLNMARFLSAGRNPAVVFTHHALSTWHYIPLPPAEMSAAIAQTVAGGANPWFAIFMDSMPSRSAEAFDAVQLNAFLERHAAHFTATQSAAETAVLLSRRTAYYYLSQQKALVKTTDSGKEQNLVMERARQKLRADLGERRKVSAELLNNEYAGCMDALTYSHIPLRVLWDEHITPNQLQAVRTLILPNSACLAKAQIRIITQFVKTGGNLIATFESGFYDEWGHPVKRPEWLKLLGIDRAEGAYDPSRNKEYCTVVSDVLSHLSKGVLLPRPLNGLKVRALQGRQNLVRFNATLGQFYTNLKGLSPYPAVIGSRFGRGRVIYVAAPIFESFNLFHLADHRMLTQDLIEWATGKTGPQIECQAPGSLAVELRRRPGELQVHLVNVTADMKRPMENVVPLTNIRIAVRASNIKRIHCLRSGRQLAYRRVGGKVAFNVPEIKDYEVVIVEYRT